MTAADERPSYGTPWHDAPPPLPVAAERAGIRGARAGLVTRSLANVVDVLVVAVLVGGGYAAVAAARFLLSPTTFTFPAPAPATLLLMGLAVQAVYFMVTWAVAGRTYGDRMLGLRVADDRGVRLGWKRCAARAALCTIFPIGLVWVLVSGENRSLQDLLLRTSALYD
ncbi:RDD family protein [Geodermatophilus sabuli]|uniref:PEP-CTERM protein-sorting domain-containing protein n=1 Tax=Geodermatophilus sabuli TaxID=1564158 RepID=A0A285EE79_9ACTN|nr:RDD family protein [Geodermatophilus sabuli]MBB3084505.1 putative RDD family membrane protein YckC [Geodermatophilus sabuli]SNX97300.1 PEP-CTERM protein-sorting domain-containing protein [Geodermatophilus sabuli]